MVKKVLSVLLVAAMLVGVLALPSFAEEDDMDLHFAVASDIHYVTPVPKTTDLVNEVMGPHRFNTANGEYTAPSGFIIDAFLKDCAENEDCDFVLISGDLATYGRTFTSEHEALAEKLRAFEKETGKQIYVINGNHDNGSADATDHNKFIEIYKEFGYDEAFATDEGTCSYAVMLNDKYMLIALDSFDEDYALASKVDAHRLNWVRKQAAVAKKTGREPILMLHHHIMEHDPFQAIKSSSYIIKTPYTVSGLLADMGIRLVFSGHFHLNDVTSYTSLLGNTIYDFAMPALNGYPAEYKMITVSEKAVAYSTNAVKSIDADALSQVCKGFSDADLRLMKTDFPQYLRNKEYMSISGGMDNNFRTDKKLFAAVSQNLIEMLDTPLYGEGSLSEQAKEQYGVIIPNSDFTTLRDLFTNIMVNHVSGRKVFKKGSAELDVLVQSLAFAVHQSSVTSVNSEWLQNMLDSALQKVTGENGLTTAEQSAVSVAYDLFGDYIADADGVDNCAGTLPGKATQKKSVSTFLATVLYIIRRIFDIPSRSK